MKRVMSIISEDDFNNEIFPIRNELYTYEGFLRAIAKYPALCGESNLDKYQKDLVMTCKRELATIFTKGRLTVITPNITLRDRFIGKKKP